MKFYEKYSREDFIALTETLNINEFVQLATAQLEVDEFVQFPIAQFEKTFSPMPQLLMLVPFTGHLEIMNRCRTDEERIFYMLYASQQRLKTEELRRCIVNQTYSSLMDKEKNDVTQNACGISEHGVYVERQGFCGFLESSSET